MERIKMPAIPAFDYMPVTTSTDPQFIPKKHTVQSYRHQQRLKKKRKNIYLKNKR